MIKSVCSFLWETDLRTTEPRLPCEITVLPTIQVTKQR